MDWKEFLKPTGTKIVCALVTLTQLAYLESANNIYSLMEVLLFPPKEPIIGINYQFFVLSLVVAYLFGILMDYLSRPEKRQHLKEFFTPNVLNLALAAILFFPLFSYLKNVLVGVVCGYIVACILLYYPIKHLKSKKRGKK